MQERSFHRALIEKDGTSQAKRGLPALSPDYALVEERDMKDWLSFAQDLAEELAYYNLDDEARGNWRSFLNLDTERLIAYLENPDPELFLPEEVQNFSKPHRILFFTFLQIIDNYFKPKLNEFSQTHLDYYYRDFLGLSPKDATSDRVNLWFELSPGKQDARIPKGTALLAGKDSLGKELIYETEEEIVVKRSQLSSTKSLFLEKEKTGLQDAREANIRDLEAGFIDMFKVVLGQPQPGDALPEFETPFQSEDPEDFIPNRIHPILGFANESLYLSFADLRLLIRTLELVKPADPMQEISLWHPINQILTEVWRQREPGGNNQVFPNTIDFHTNFTLATGVNPIPADPLGTPFETFPLIDNIYDLYEEIKQREADEALRILIEEDLSFPSVDTFRDMMRQLVSQIRDNWIIIYTLLQQAGENIDPTLALTETVPLNYVQTFDDLVTVALPGFETDGSGYNIFANPDINSIESYQASLNSLETYFYLRPEDLLFIFDTYQANQDPADQDEVAWNTVYDLMQKAYESLDRNRKNEARAQELFKVYEDAIEDGLNPDTAFDLMVRESLGDPNPGDQLPNEIDSLLEINDLAPLQRSIYIRENLFLSTTEFETLLQERQNPRREVVLTNTEILAAAEGKKRGYADPGPARIERFNHIYAADNAKTVEVNLGLEGEETVRWRTFGERQMEKLPEARSMSPAEIGFAIRSPILQLSAGIRKLKLRCTFEVEPHLPGNLSEILLQKPFSFYFSGAEEWYELPLEQTPVPFRMTEGSGDDEQLVLEMLIELDEQVPAIAPGPLELEGIGQQEAVMKVLLREFVISNAEEENEEITAYQNAYQAFKSLKLESAKLEVVVQGLAPTHLQNKQGVLDPTKAIEPFGLRARAGSSLLIGHPETSFKRLDGLDINLTWMGVPQADMGAYYANYVLDRQGNPVSFQNGSFRGDLILHDNGARISMSDLPLDLFHSSNAALPHSLSIGAETDLFSGEQTSNTPNLNTSIPTISGQEDYSYLPEQHPKIANRLSDWNRFLELRLDSPGFMDELYASRASKIAVRLAIEIARRNIDNSTESSAYEINSPYTPQLEKISLSYRASANFDFRGETISEHKDDEFIHLHAFGYKRVGSSQANENFLIPQFENEGTLFLGFVDTESPQILSLLVQVAEGSADPDLDLVQLKWKYLSGDEWKSLDEGLILEDNTNGLTNSGIVKISLPGDASIDHNLMPDGLIWLAIEASSNTLSVCDLVDVHTQGISAIFVNKDNATDHLASPLASETITKFQKPIPGIQAIHQPYTSFGGKMPEQEDVFYTRVSERLRHKQRALNIWDYEHLVLDKFPEIYKAKCLPADIDTYPDEAGRVDVIVIPDIKGKFPFDPFEPKAPINLLKSIEQYLLEISPPFSTIKVQNPDYIQLKVRFAVKFLEGKDPGFYLNQLNEELKQFLAPWAYEQGAEIEFGGKVYANVIVNFIDERDYVDFVAGIQVFSSEDGINFFPAAANTADGGIQTDLPSAIWVSARQHEIDLITDNNFEDQSFEGIGHMRIELDFQLDNA